MKADLLEFRGVAHLQATRKRLYCLILALSMVPPFVWAYLAFQLAQAQAFLRSQPTYHLEEPQKVDSAYTKAWSQVNQQLNVPWVPILQMFSQIAKPEVSILSVEPSVDTSSLQLKGLVKDHQILQDLLVQVQSNKSLSDVRLVTIKHTELAPNSLYFEILSTWNLHTGIPQGVQNE